MIGIFQHNIAQILFLRFFLRFREFLLCGYGVFQASYGMKPFLSFSIARFFSIAMLYCFSIHSFALVSSPSSTLHTFADTQLRFFLRFFPPFVFSLFLSILFPFSLFPSPTYKHCPFQACVPHTSQRVASTSRLDARTCWRNNLWHSFET